MPVEAPLETSGSEYREVERRKSQSRVSAPDDSLMAEDDRVCKCQVSHLEWVEEWLTDQHRADPRLTLLRTY